MAEIRWTLQAADDLEAIAEFIAADSPHYASLFVMDVLAAVERLADFPNSGRILPDLNLPHIREIIFGNYRIIYQHKNDTAAILTIHHQARLLDPTRFVLET